MSEISLDTLQSVVFFTMLENSKSKDDDFILVSEVYKKVAPDAMKKSVEYAFAHHTELGLPSFESITRARRKIQQENPWMASTPEVKALRDKNEEIYHEHFSEQ